MAVYLKKTSDGKVIAMGDMGAVKKFGGEYDKKVSDSAWFDTYHQTAYIDENGKIVLGMDDNELKEWGAEKIRRERDMLLKQDCDSLSALRLNSMTMAEKNKWAAYRKALLDIPQQSGFPWDGDTAKAPWPKKPS